MLSAAPLAADHYVAAEGALSYLWILIALPAFGAALLLLGGRRGAAGLHRTRAGQ
jgi:hypothetical protein